MPDELTGPAEGGTPDSGGDGDDLDTELAKHLNVDQLPSDPNELKQLVTKRYKDLRTGLREAQESKSSVESKVSNMEGQIQQLTQLLGGQDNGNQQGGVPDWVRGYTPPENASDTEVLADFVDRAINERVGPKFDQLERLAELQAMNMVEQAKARYDDWDEIEPKVAETLNRYPQMPLDEAVQHVRGSNPETMREQIRRELKAELEQKKTAAGSGSTVTRPGTSQTSEKMPDPRETTQQDYFEFARKQAEEELGISS